jgi:hypothetical protein
MSPMDTVTRGLLGIRLTFQAFFSVINRAASPSGTTQIGVGLGRPSLVNVVGETYLALVTSANVGEMHPM